MIDKKALSKLRKELPHGCSTTIRTRLISKFPDMNPFSIDYIRKVLDPDDKRINTIILGEAILYRDELAAEKANIESRIYKT